MWQKYFGSIADKLLQIEKEEGLGKVFLLVLSWAFLLFSTGFLTYMIIVKTDPSSASWSLFINLKVLQNMFNIIAVVWTVFLLDWMYPGQCVKTILSVNDSSTDEAKRTAAYFLIGVAACIAYVVRV